MNTEAKNQTMKEKAWTICRDLLGGQWKKISFEEFGFSDVRGGLSNTLYRCFLPESAPNDPKVPKNVLMRIYGPIQDDPNVIVAEAVTFMLLSERRLGPRLYGLFPRGRLEEFIPSHSLCSREMRLYSHLIAREMAKIHVLDVPVKKNAEIFRWADKWLSELEGVLESDKGDAFMSLKEYKKELEWIKIEMAKTNSPVVYCHNDLQGGNVLYREDATENGNPEVILIDFEFGSYNYRGFDLANHLCEWCFDYDTAEYPHFQFNFDKFPTIPEQIEFFTAYLDQLAEEGVQFKTTREKELQSLLHEVNIFAAAAHILWTIWSAKMTLTSDYGFAHKEHGKTRKKLYQKFKERHLASVSNTKNGS